MEFQSSYNFRKNSIVLRQEVPIFFNLVVEENNLDVFLFKEFEDFDTENYQISLCSSNYHQENGTIEEIINSISQKIVVFFNLYKFLYSFF